MDTEVPITTGKWHHSIISYKKLDLNNHSITVYLDGVKIDQSSAGSPLNIHDDFHLGHYVDGGNQYFKGKLDDVRIYQEKFQKKKRIHYIILKKLIDLSITW